MKNRPEIKKRRKSQAGTACLTPEVIRQYIEGSMVEDGALEVENHCDTCKHCAADIGRYTILELDANMLNTDKDLSLRFAEKTKKLRDQLDKPNDFSLKRGMR